jgi:molybdenum cofactor biosynthesis protein MoaF
MRTVLLAALACVAIVSLDGHASAGRRQGGRDMDSLRGKTVRWSFADGPTAGMVFEHTFEEDGSVVWRIVEGQGKGASRREPRCATVQVSQDVHTVSYLAASGHTLTVVLNLATGRMVGFGSNNTDWSSQSGTFETVR